MRDEIKSVIREMMPEIMAEVKKAAAEETAQMKTEILQNVSEKQLKHLESMQAQEAKTVEIEDLLELGKEQDIPDFLKQKPDLGNGVAAAIITIQGKHLHGNPGLVTLEFPNCHEQLLAAFPELKDGKSVRVRVTR